ncbi:MAG: hypothetical protein ABEJ23_08175 [Haloarculaceae archaeon]
MSPGPPLGRVYGLRVSPAPSLASVRALVIAHSPVHYEDGDMRRAYRVTRVALLALLVVGSVALLSRLVVTGLFVALVSADPLLVGGFNALVTVAGSAGVLGTLWLRRHARRRLRRRRARLSRRPERL